MSQGATAYVPEDSGLCPRGRWLMSQGATAYVPEDGGLCPRGRRLMSQRTAGYVLSAARAKVFLWYFPAPSSRGLSAGSILDAKKASILHVFNYI